MQDKNMNNNNKWLRFASFMEGLSWLTLLFVAMPLKYMAGLPKAVTIVGMGHGMLFIVLILLLAQALNQKSISGPLGLRVFLASFVPFGFLFVDGKIKRAAVNA
jgi:integral membrane protein